MQTLIRLSHFLLLIAAVSGSVAAQQTGQLSGRLTDPAGAAIKGASFEVVQHGRTVATLTSDAEGRFSAPLAAGEYELRIVVAGFAEQRQKINVATINQPLAIQLEPASLSETITVTPARTAIRLSNAPMSVSVLSANDVAQAAAQTVDDLLRQIPGFSIFRRSSSIVANPTTQGVSLRGAGASGASRTLVLSDGIPLNDAFGGWVYWDRVPRAAISQIEVVRGGASDLYGSDALSGVINVLSRDANAARVKAEASYGTRNTSDVTFFAGDKWRRLAASVTGEATRTDGYFLLAPTARGTADEAAASRHRTLGARLQYDLKDGIALFARGSLFDEDRKNGTLLQRNDTATESLAVGGRFRLSNADSLQVALFANRQRFHQSFTAVAANRNTETLTRLQFVPSRDAGLSLTYSRANSTRNFLVAGVDVRGVRGTSDEIVYANNRATTFVSAGGRQRRAGFFAQDIAELTTRLTLTASMRYDNWRDSSAASVERTLATGAVRPRFFDPRSLDAFSPRLALAFKLNPRFSLRASGYRAFRAPTLNELYRSFRVGDTLTQANERLTAERLTGGEAGVTFATAKAINAHLTGYWTETVNPIANFTLSTTPTLITRERRNLGRTRSRGLEAESDFNLSQHWRISAGYLFAAATVRRAPQDARLEGLWIPQVPRHQFTLQTVYAQPRYLTAALQFRATGKQFDDDQNRLPLGAFALVDATVSRQLGRWVEAFIAVQNLFDERFVVGRTPLETLGMPRLVRGGLRLRFER